MTKKDHADLYPLARTDAHEMLCSGKKSRLQDSTKQYEYIFK